MTDSVAETGRALFQSQRQRAILAQTLDQGRVDVAELARSFRVTTETIRRDLSDLQSQRMVRRVHGGAVPWEKPGFEPLLAIRNDQQDNEKRRIAKVAAHEIPDTGSIIIDSGSTLTRFAEHVPTDRELRVVTNSLATAHVLAENERLSLVVIGGTVQRNTLAMVDAQAVEAVREMSVDTLFISSDGVSIEGALTTPYRAEAALKRAMIEAARRVVVLVDHSKFGNDHFARFAEWTDIDVFITDAAVGDETVSALEALGPTVLRA